MQRQTGFKGDKVLDRLDAYIDSGKAPAKIPVFRSQLKVLEVRLAGFPVYRGHTLIELDDSA